MSIENKLVEIIPEPIRRLIRPVKNRLFTKDFAELSFWRSRLEIDSGTFVNSTYEKLLLGIAQETSQEFLENKIVADFGCGPRGSLVWARSAALRIGIDVLADRYADEFTDNITSHEMIYLKSTEKVIPLPSDFVDVMFTLNAIDHVKDFPTMCAEILRVIKPGGLFIGSFNLEEPATSSEPQQLNESMIRDNLLNRLEVLSYRVAAKGSGDDPYAAFFGGSMSYEPGEEGFLWVKAVKPSTP
jgi:SAM-dependent methyltransferase